METESGELAAEPADGDADIGGQKIVTERLLAFGMVVEWAAGMEVALRRAFCSLLGTKYAAVVAAGQSTGWLIAQCRALTEANREIVPAGRQEILTALRACEAADKQRNTILHGMKTASGPDGSLLTIKSRYRRTDPIVESWTPTTIRNAASDLITASLRLHGVMSRLVSPDAMVLDQALAWERQASEQAESS